MVSLKKQAGLVQDMTLGRPIKLILEFYFPLLMGSFFGQLYNIADTSVVGYFIGEEAFAQCTSLKGTLTIPDSCIYIGKTAFSNNNIKKVVIGKNVETLSYGAFSKCSQLKEFTCNSKKLKEIGEYVFYEDYSLKKMYFKSSNQSFSTSTLKLVVMNQ